MESGNINDTNTLKQKIEQDQELGRLDDTSKDVNSYRELMANNAENIETVLSQMDKWSILSNVVNYIQYDRHQKNFHINTVNKEKYKRNIKYRRGEMC